MLAKCMASSDMGCAIKFYKTVKALPGSCYTKIKHSALGFDGRLESIMLQNLPIMLFSICPIFCLLCLLLCFSDMHYAFVFSLFPCKTRPSYDDIIASQNQIIDICSNPQGVLIQDLENECICRIYRALRGAKIFSFHIAS